MQRVTFRPGEVYAHVTNMSLEQLVQSASHLPTGTLFGLSDWMRSDRFDIEATTVTNSNFENELACYRFFFRTDSGSACTADGLSVPQFNVRLGDPETQPLMMRLASDWGEVLMAAAARLA